MYQAKPKAEAKIKAEAKSKPLAEAPAVVPTASAIFSKPSTSKVEAERPLPKQLKKRATRNSEDAGLSALTFTPVPRARVETKRPQSKAVDEESVVNPGTNFFERLEPRYESDRETLFSDNLPLENTPVFPGNWAETSREFEFDDGLSGLDESPISASQAVTAPETPRLENLEDFISEKQLGKRRADDLGDLSALTELTVSEIHEERIAEKGGYEVEFETEQSVGYSAYKQPREPLPSYSVEPPSTGLTTGQIVLGTVAQWILDKEEEEKAEILRQEAQSLAARLHKSNQPQKPRVIVPADSEEEEMVDVRKPQLKSMPSRQARDRPEFDESEPENIVRYFEDLEMYFEMAGISEDANKERKKWVGTYVKPKLESEWKTLDSFETGTYGEYKDEILRDYDAVAKLVRGSIQRLEQICKEHQRISPEDIDDFLTLKRQFKYEATKLQKPPVLLANHTLVEKFMSCLTPAYRKQVYQRLDLIVRTDERIKVMTEPNAIRAGAIATVKRSRPEDRYELNDVIKMAEEIAREQNPGEASVSLHSRVGATTAPEVAIKMESFHLAPVTRQIEELRAEIAAKRDDETRHQKMLEEMKTTMQQLAAMVGTAGQQPARPLYQGQRPPNPGFPQRPEGFSRPDYVPRQDFGNNYKCFYCGLGGHVMRFCTAKEGHLRMGKIIETGDGKLALPDNTPLTYDSGKPALLRVEEFHAMKKVDAMYQGQSMGSVMQFAQIKELAGSNSVYTNKPKDHRDELISQLRNIIGRADTASERAPAPIVPIPKQIDMMDYSNAYEIAAKKERDELMSMMNQLDYSREEDLGFTST